MAITAMGLGSKSLSGDYNLDPQDQFWSWLHGMAKDHSKGTIFSGFKVEPTDPAGMSVQVGGHALTPDSAVYYGDGTNGNFFSRHNVLFSSDGVPTKVELSGASTSGSTTYYIVSYVMPASSVAASSQTAGTPELVKTMAVTGASYGAPTASEIEAAKASGAEPGYIIWGQVSISEKTTTVTSSNITQANDMSAGNMRTTRGLLYDDSLTYEEKAWSQVFNTTSQDRTYFHANRFSFTGSNHGLVVGFFGGRYDVPGQSAWSRNFMGDDKSWAPSGNYDTDASGFLSGTPIVIHMYHDGRNFYWSPGSSFGNDAEFSATLVYPCDLTR